MTIKETLQEVRRLIDIGWTQNAYARLSDGRTCGPSDNRAVCWCLAGAFMRVGFENPETFYSSNTRARMFLRTWIQVPLTDFNDAASSKEEVLLVLDKAIARS